MEHMELGICVLYLHVCACVLLGAIVSVFNSAGSFGQRRINTGVHVWHIQTMSGCSGAQGS